MFSDVWIWCEIISSLTCKSIEKATWSSRDFPSSPRSMPNFQCSFMQLLDAYAHAAKHDLQNKSIFVGFSCNLFEN